MILAMTERTPLSLASCFQFNQVDPRYVHYILSSPLSPSEVANNLLREHKNNLQSLGVNFLVLGENFVFDVVKGLQLFDQVIPQEEVQRLDSRQEINIDEFAQMLELRLKSIPFAIQPQPEFVVLHQKRTQAAEASNDFEESKVVTFTIQLRLRGKITEITSESLRLDAQKSNQVLIDAEAIISQVVNQIDQHPLVSFLRED